MSLTVSEIAGQEWYSKSLEAKAQTVDTTYSLERLQKELVYFNRLLEREPHLRDAFYYKALIFYRMYQADPDNAKKSEYLLQAGRYVGTCLSGKEDDEEYLALYLLIRTALLKEKLDIRLWPGEKSPKEFLSIDSKNPRLLFSQACFLSFLKASPEIILEKLNAAKNFLNEENSRQYPTWGLTEIIELESSLE